MKYNGNVTRQGSCNKKQGGHLSHFQALLYKGCQSQHLREMQGRQGAQGEARISVRERGRGLREGYIPTERRNQDMSFRTEVCVPQKTFFFNPKKSNLQIFTEYLRYIGTISYPPANTTKHKPLQDLVAVTYPTILPVPEGFFHCWIKGTRGVGLQKRERLQD